MTMSRVTALAGTLWMSAIWLTAAPARAEDQAEMKKDEVDQRARAEKEQVDQQAKREKERIDGHAQAKKNEIDRENSTRTKPTAADDVSDAWITTKVKASFVGDKSLKGADIHVETAQRGVVVLSGYVPTNSARVRAISLAWDTKGVKKVDDQLQLKVTP